MTTLTLRDLAFLARNYTDIAASGGGTATSSDLYLWPSGAFLESVFLREAPNADPSLPLGLYLRSAEVFIDSVFL